MEQSIKRFLEFNGKKIYFIAKDGSYWIAIKPICEALKVQFEHQRITLKNDEILNQLPCEHMVVAADGRLKKCFVYLNFLFTVGYFLFSLKVKN